MEFACKLTNIDAFYTSIGDFKQGGLSMSNHLRLSVVATADYDENWRFAPWPRPVISEWDIGQERVSVVTRFLSRM